MLVLSFLTLIDLYVITYTLNRASNMRKEKDTYSATVVDTGDGVSCDIDVRPPFVPSEGLLDFVSDLSGVGLQHFVTTPNTTRLSAHILDEMVSDEIRDQRFQDAADTIVQMLRSVDGGLDVIHQVYPCEAEE